MFGYSGLLKGRKGDSVYYVRRGKQIVRQYIPNPADPKSPAQVRNRAIMSELGSISSKLRSVLCFAPKGLQSMRNRFIAANWNLVTDLEGTLAIDLWRLELTGGYRIPTDFEVERVSKDYLSIQLVADASALYDAVIYAWAEIDEKGDLGEVHSRCVVYDEKDGHFVCSLKQSVAHLVFWSYGLVVSSGRMRAYLGDIAGDSISQVVWLIRERLVSELDYSPTCTKGAELIASETHVSSEDMQPTSWYYVSLFCNEGGEVFGSGWFPAGGECTVVADPDDEYCFVGWFSDGVKVSESSTYTFMVSAYTQLEARFAVAVNLIIQLTNGCSCSGAGVYPVDTVVAVECTPAEGYVFAGYYLDGLPLSGSNPMQLFLGSSMVVVAQTVAVAPTVAVHLNVTAGGTAEGDGDYIPGQLANIVCHASEGYAFEGVYLGNTKVSEVADFWYEVREEVFLKVKFVPALS